MGLRAATGYVAHAALLTYWLWTVAATAPQLRRGTRGRRLRAHVLLLKTAGLVLTAVVVGIIHFWATAWWQVVVALPVAAVLALLLRRAYRRTVAAPRGRLALDRRPAHGDVRPRRAVEGPQHLRLHGARTIPSPRSPEVAVHRGEHSAQVAATGPTDEPATS